MKFPRRILGILVMIAGILGLVLSLAGLVMVWVAKPTVAVYGNSTIETLKESVVTSQGVVEVTGQALGATIDSIEALATMLSTTAATVEDTKPVLDEFDVIMAETLPSTLETTTDSIYTAQEAAQVLEGAIQSLDAFRFLLGDAPLVGAFVDQSAEPYDPERSLAVSLGELATNLEGLPETFVEMSAKLNDTDDNLETIQGNLVTMADSVGLISSSLGEYEKTIVQSQSSMDNLSSILTDIQNNLDTILKWAALLLTLFFVWLLAAQVVILSQGWELYQGTAGRLEGEDE